MMDLSVTITGADDGTDPNQLAHLSRFYPFVEWGILFSEKRRAGPRYPSLRWIRSLEDLAAKRLTMKFAMHLCGAESRLAILNAHDFDPGPAWNRVQLNGYETGTAMSAWRENAFNCNFRWILQARTTESLGAAIDDACVSGAHVLYDPSGGAGKGPGAWPEMFALLASSEKNSIDFGFAGGIGPDNVEYVIGEVLARNARLARIWIDMESGVRTDDKFDLDKVATVLAAVGAARRNL
jgi:phosphoribosylanthranilate isomerase